MHHPANKERALAAGKKIAAGARAWLRHANAEEEERGYEGINIAAAWTEEGVLVVLARRDVGAVLDAHLRDHDIASPQYRDRIPKGDA